MIGCKTKEANVHIVDNASERLRGVASTYAPSAARPYQQQNQSAQAPNRAFNYRGRLEPPRPFRRENRKYTPLPMPMANLYAYLLERKLVTLLFSRPKEGPPPPGFDLSKKCKHHFRAKGHTLKECFQLRDCDQDLLDNKLIWFDNATALNIITNPLPPHQDGNVNSIIIVKERVLDFSSSSFLWKAMLRALVQESHLDLKAPNLQTQEGVIIRMPKPFPYEDSHHVPWKYDVSLISTRTRKEEVCSNISSGLSGLIRSGHCYTSEELEKRRKEIGKGIAEPVRNRVTTEEAKEFLKVIRNSKYNVIQQLNKSLAQTSILALLLSSKVHHNALLKVLKETRVPTSATKSSFEGMVSMMLATNQISFTNNELPPKGRDHALPMYIIIKCEDMIVAAGAVGHSRKVDSPYNMLLGRPWLHAAGTVASTLH
ncbi:uncharacterized protein LOC115950024 [Quercus lobata]|uniref:uncharacterized protein LOC115950024 n=1 Tax=Quercus lobata TaxID=97700 RepID=UPI00124722C3|nr:uncharacterized protein LOC115950024 [Quercus lobata]